MIRTLDTETRNFHGKEIEATFKYNTYFYEIECEVKLILDNHIFKGYGNFQYHKFHTFTEDDKKSVLQNAYEKAIKSLKEKLSRIANGVDVKEAENNLIKVFDSLEHQRNLKQIVEFFLMKEPTSQFNL